MKRVTFLTRLTLIAGLFLAGAGSVFATVTIAGATGGGTISADTASNAPSPAWTTLGPITITEGASTDFTNGTGVTLILRVPAGFQFNTAVIPNVTFAASKNIQSATAAMTDSSNITVTLTISGTAVASDSLTIGSTTGIQVRPNVKPATRHGQPYLSSQHRRRNRRHQGYYELRRWFHGQQFRRVDRSPRHAINHHAIPGTDHE